MTAQGGPGRAQGDPGRVREAEGGPGEPREAQERSRGGFRGQKCGRGHSNLRFGSSSADSADSPDSADSAETVSGAAEQTLPNTRAGVLG